jgi:transcriptional regulator with XRE-family HTH domain
VANGNFSELADFLRSRRERLSPAKVGLPPGRRRRTPGLRREEVAELAGIGVDWYVRLEQGRSVNPSLATTDALSRALRLNKAEHAHLRALAQRSERMPFVRETVPEAIRRIIEGLNQPAYVTGRRWDVLAWNAAADEVFAFARVAEEERNVLMRMFTRPATKRLFGSGWEQEARRMIAQFRSNYDLFAGDPAFENLLEKLRTESAEFSVWWQGHDVRGAAAGAKLLHHPKKGELKLDYASFQSNDDPALKLVIYAMA